MGKLILSIIYIKYFEISAQNNFKKMSLVSLKNSVSSLVQ